MASLVLEKSRVVALYVYPVDGALREEGDIATQDEVGGNCLIGGISADGKVNGALNLERKDALVPI